MPADKEILTELSGMINEIAGVPTDAVTPEKELVTDLDLDSLSRVEIAVAAEDKFGVTISDQELVNLKTVQDVVDFISSRPLPTRPLSAQILTACKGSRYVFVPSGPEESSPAGP